MLLFNNIAIALGIAAIVLAIILYLKSPGPLIRYFLATMVFMVCFIISDVVVLKIPEKAGATLDVVDSYFWIPDLFFVLFMFFWILVVGSINDMKLLIPAKFLICVFVVYYIGVELLVHYKVDNAIMVFNLLFDLFLAVNGLYYFIFGFRHRETFVNKYLITALGICMVIYCLITAYEDYIINRQITNGSFQGWPQDPMIMLGIAFEIITIIYFFHIDPLDLRSKSNKPLDVSVLHNYYDLSPREAEITVLLYEGLSNPEIAKAAFISENTVKRHLTSIYKKTGTSSRYELITKLMKLK